MTASRIRSRFVHFYVERGFSAVVAAVAVSSEARNMGHDVPSARIIHITTDLILAAR